MSNTYFVTGALGCIGAWVVKHLVDRGDTPVVFDVGGDPRRIRDILDIHTLRQHTQCSKHLHEQRMPWRTSTMADASRLVSPCWHRLRFCHQLLHHCDW